MEKGQHLRLLISDTTGSSAAYKFIAFATDLTFHLSATLEDSSTKDSSDANGEVWQENEITARTGDIQFGGLVGVGTDAGAKKFKDIIDGVSDSVVYWKIAAVSGANNRVIGKTICSGEGKISNCQADAQAGQRATYSGTLNIYGPVTVGND